MLSLNIWNFYIKRMKSAAVILIALSLVSEGSSVCHDIDTQACILMLKQTPDLCSEPMLSSTACPKTCNLCGLECYQCDQQVTDFTACNQTITCPAGERCMLRTATSSIDGHHEYFMQCANLATCDGIESRKRGIVSQCCSEDLCNYPTYRQTTPTTPSTTTATTRTTTPLTTTSTTTSTTTTPSTTTTTRSHLTTTPLHTTQKLGCARDIQVLAEDSKVDSNSGNYIKSFLKDLVSGIEIGPSDNLLAMATFDNGVHSQFNFRSHEYKSSLLSAIDMINFRHNNNHIDRTDVLKFLQNHLKTSTNHEDRSTYKDVVIIITDHIPNRKRFILDTMGFPTIPSIPSGNSPSIHTLSTDIIVINIGDAVHRSAFSAMATDSHHVIDVPDYSSLQGAVPRVLALLCV